MNAYELKQYIIDNDKIEFILEKFGCHSIKEYGKEYRAGLPDHKNKTSVAVKKETLGVKVFQSDGKIVRGDIITLCMYINKLTFPQANKYIHNVLDLEYKIDYNSNEKKKDVNDPLEIFKKVKKRRSACNVYDLEILNEDILDEYLPFPHIDWIKDGIMPWTCERFNIGYAPNKKRIVIPERYWSGSKNDYIGIMGRTTIKEHELLDIPKYYPLKAFPKSMNLYGLQENYDGIQKAGYVVVFESQKSVLKRHSRLDETSVSVGCHDISDEQIRILIGLDVDIVIAMDKGIDINHIRSMCDKFYGIRNVSYIYDKWDLLNDKESPADKPNKIYNYLFKYKTNYDEKERKEYIKWLEKQEKNLKN